MNYAPCKWLATRRMTKIAGLKLIDQAYSLKLKIDAYIGYALNSKFIMQSTQLCCTNISIYTGS